MTDLTRLTLDDLWQGYPPSRETFDPAAITHLPEAAQRYLKHAIVPGTPLASAVRLEMSGHIKLNEKWLPFEADQVIRWDRGLLWKAKAKMGPLSIRGSDRLLDGEGAMRWRLMGVIPVMTANGPDISRSAVGRLQAESVWIPSVLLADDIEWTAEDVTHPHATVQVMGDEAEIALTVDRTGRLLQTAMRRWGNPAGGAFHEVPFGAIALEESTFGGYTIPTKLRAGWHVGSERFDSEGEFWRASITYATYR